MFWLLSSFCRPPESYAALGQQLQVLERPGWKEASQPSAASGVDAVVFGPVTLQFGAVVLSPAGLCLSLSLAAQPAKGPPRLHSPASVARQASTRPSIQKPQKDFLTGSCNSDTAGLTTLSDKNCDKLTQTHNIPMNFSCLPGIRSVAGQVTWLREGPQMPPGKASASSLSHGLSCLLFR